MMPAFVGGNVAWGTSTKDAGVTFVTTPTPPAGMGGWYELNTAAAHRLTPRGHGSIDNPTGFGTPYWCEQGWLRYDTGDVVDGHYLVRDNTTTSDEYAVKYADGELTIIYGGQTVGTIPVSPDTDYHLMVFMPPTASVSASCRVIALLDKTVVLDETVTASQSVNRTNNAPTFGEAALITSSTVKWYVGGWHGGFTDLDDPIGKLTTREWSLHLGQTPFYNEGTKSTGTDAAALVDERPPNGSGTTDSDYFHIIDAANAEDQSVELVNTLLGSGEVVHAIKTQIWDRGFVSGKAANVDHLYLDTTNTVKTALVSFVTATSYAEHTRPSGAPVLVSTAPDGAQLRAKDNTYLDLVEVGASMNAGSDVNAAVRVSTLLVEVAIVADGDDVTLEEAAARRIFIIS